MTSEHVADLARFTERLTERLRGEGFSHPHVAAVALAVRGAASVDVDEFAHQLGLRPHELQAIEDGLVARGELPATLVEAARELGLAG